MASIAINGLGRIGRAALKILEQADGAEVVAASDRYRGIPGVADDPVVSADIIGDPRASVVDAAMTRVVDQTLVKVMSWYDNKWGFTCQMIREAFSALGLPPPDLSQIRP
jgi:glyceraldehyde 3-phosphate dehydrogenase